MEPYVGVDRLAPVIAVALDEAWGNRYGEHAVEELEAEGKHIANALLKDFTVTLSQPKDTEDLPELGCLPLNTVIVVDWRSDGLATVLRKIHNRRPGALSSRWESVNSSEPETWDEWELELICRSIRVVALGLNDE